MTGLRYYFDRVKIKQKIKMPKIILIPAAGEGKRFQLMGIKQPKPLIQVHKRTLLEHTIDCFPLSKGDKLLICTQSRHNVRFKLKNKLEKLYPNISINWHELNELMPGQLATAVASISKLSDEININNNYSLFIHNCDTGFKWSKSLDKVQTFASMAVFKAAGSHWSFAKESTELPGIAVEIAEKKRISELASIGLYGFRSSAEFLDHGSKSLRIGRTINGEHYIAPMLQAAISSGEKISIPRVSNVKMYGTPQELCKTFNVSLDELTSANKY